MSLQNCFKKCVCQTQKQPVVGQGGEMGRLWGNNSRASMHNSPQSTAPIRRVAVCIWWHKNTSLKEECSDCMPKVLLQPCGACLQLGDSLHLLGSPFVTGSKGPKAQSQGQLPADRLRLQRLARPTPKMLLFPCLL